MRSRHFFSTRSLLSLTLVIALAATLVASAFADLTDNKRSKVIDFEDEVVEGVNRKPLDSLNQISERNGHKKKPHLYRKRGGFKSETAENLRVMRYTPQ
jgi:hypothetical protein